MCSLYFAKKLFNKLCIGFINPHLYALIFFFLLEVKIWYSVFLNKVPHFFFSLGCSLCPFPEVYNWLLQSYISKYTPPTELGKCSITKFKCNNSVHSNIIYTKKMYYLSLPESHFSVSDNKLLLVHFLLQYIPELNKNKRYNSDCYH